MALLRTLIDWNVKASRAFDRLFPEAYRIDGNRYFIEHFVPPYLVAGFCVYDVGGVNGRTCKRMSNANST